MRSASESPLGFDNAVRQLPACSLDDSGREEQRERYAALAGVVSIIRREPHALVVRFDENLDQATLEQALAVEARCCPFFQFSFERSDRELRVTVADAQMRQALEVLAEALGASG